MATPPSFIVRPFEQRDFEIVRTWLPDALGGTPAAAIHVAVNAATGAIAGVGSIRVFCDRVGRFLLFVDPAKRRAGCGTALLDGLRGIAQARGATRWLSARSVDATASDADSVAAAAFCQTKDMAAAQVIVRYRTEMKPALEILEPLYQRSVRGPADSRRAHIVAVDAVDLMTLAEFVVRDVGGIREDVAARLTGHGLAFCKKTSMVALVDDAIVGAVLNVQDGDTLLVETRVVHSAYRGGWINLALMHHGILAAAAIGIRTLEFEHDICERDTAKLARRFGAIEVGRRQCWGCSLPASVLPPNESSDWHADALREPRIRGLPLEALQEQLFFAGVNDVLQTLSERGVEGLSVVNHVRGVTLQMKLVRHGPEVFDRTTGLNACLLFAVLPKSASLYAFDTLAAGLGLDKVAVCAHRFPHETLNENTAARLAVPGTISHSHIDGRIGNLAAINSFLERMVVHVRDPRQVVLSAVHHLNDLRLRKGASHVASFGLPLGKNYFALPLTEQIDAMIAEGLPEFVNWIESWLTAAAMPLFRPRVLFTRYEDMHANAPAFFRSILDFYGAAWRFADFQPPAASQGTRHFRKGLTDEWRTAFTAAQRETCGTLIKPSLLERFDWPVR